MILVTHADYTHTYHQHSQKRDGNGNDTAIKFTKRSILMLVNISRKILLIRQFFDKLTTD